MEIQSVDINFVGGSPNPTKCHRVGERKMDRPDRMDRILEKLSERINQWESASREAIEAETNFKSFEAMQQKAHMDAGSSAAKAQTETRSTGEWANHYRAVAQASLTAEKLKKQIMLGQLMFDAERTKQANQRRIV